MHAWQKLRFIYILIATSFAKVQNIEIMFLSDWYEKRIVNERILMVITRGILHKVSSGVTLCPCVGGTLRPTLENSSGPGWVVQEEPATTSCKTSTSGENDPAACSWTSFSAGIVNFKGFMRAVVREGGRERGRESLPGRI